MSLDALQNLLQSMFARINEANSVPLPVTMWEDYKEEILPLLISPEVQEHFVQLGRDIALPRSFETARVLLNLRQRFEPIQSGRSLVGRIRAEAFLRERPKRDQERSMLPEVAGAIAKLAPDFERFSSFHVKGWDRVLNTIRNQGNLVITAPTGSGKTEVFLMPTIYSIAQSLAQQSREIPHFVLLYPRVALLKDQLARIFRYVYYAEREYLSTKTLFGGYMPIGIGKGIVIGFQFGGVSAEADNTRNNEEIFDENGVFRIIDQCPICKNGQLKISGRRQRYITILKCTNSECAADFRTTISKNDHANAKPHILVTTAESLDRIYLNPVPEFEAYLKVITGIIIDEVHMYFSLYGVHISNLIRRIEKLKDNKPLIKIAASATISNPENFAAKLFYGTETQLVPVHEAEDYERDPAGLEVIYFLQSPEEGNRPGATPTLIQSVMALGHAALSDGNRTIVFTESLDMVGRLETQIRDAETKKWNDLTSRRGLWEFRTNLRTLIFADQSCPQTNPLACSNIYLEGECWRGILGGENCVQSVNGLRERELEIVQVSSKQQTSYWKGDVVIATSVLEVGVDDERIKSTIHYLPPRTVFSFIQRRGRAGRKPGEITYTLMVLGNTPSDQFYFFHRNRLINGTYELPLNPQNPILRAMHERLEIERERMRESVEEKGTQSGIWSWLWETIARCSIIDRYYSEKFDTYQRRGIEEQRKFVKKWIFEEKAALENYINLRWLLRTIEDEAPDVLQSIARETVEAINRFLVKDAEISEIGQKLQTLNTSIFDLLLKENDTEARAPLKTVQENMLRIWDTVSRQNWGIEPRHIENLYDFFHALEALYPKDRQKQWVLNSAPDVLKIVLQSMFYLHLGLEDDDISCPSQISYFVPSAYFQSVQPIIVELFRQKETANDPELHQEDITNASAMLIPYRPIYRYHKPPFLSLLETEHDPAWVSSDRSEVTIRLRAEGLRQGGVLIPQKIYVKPIKSDDQGQQIVKLCPECYAIYSINRQRSCHAPLRLVKLYAEPIIERTYDNQQISPRQITRTLRFLPNMQGTTTMRGSEVRANRVLERDGGYTVTQNLFREFRALYDTPIRYSISTNGIAWDLSSILPQVLQNNTVRQRVESVTIRGVRKIFNEELLLHTASHMLLKTISSISGVNEQQLEYWYDLSRQEVVIWERYEGGAGISEIFENTLRSNPIRVYQELLSSILCLMDLAERPQNGISSEDLRIRLANRWGLAPDNETLINIVQEAERERQIQDQQRNEEARLVCRPPQGYDGCPVCIHTTYCTKRNEQPLTLSRLAGETLLRYLARRITREEVETLMQEASTQGFTPPLILTADPMQGVYHVLLL